MTTLNPSKDRRGLLSIYKPGQGKWVRWGTVAALGIVVLLGTYWLVQRQLATANVGVKLTAGIIWTTVGLAFIYWVVNSAKMAEFLIMTESEMRKVSWPSRRDVFNSTRVVILATLALGLLLYLVDVAFLAFFRWLGVG